MKPVIDKMKLRMDSSGLVIGIGGVDISPGLDSLLEHYGVLGMKWGIRKDDRKGGSGKSSKKKKPRVTRQVITTSNGSSRTIEFNPNKATVTQRGDKVSIAGSRSEVRKVMDQLNLKSISITGNQSDVQKLQDELKNSKKTKAPKTGDAPEAQRKTRQLTDQELSAAINRMRLENDYARLTKKPPTRGVQFMENLANSAVTGLSSGLVNQVAVPMVTRALQVQANKYLKGDYRFNFKGDKKQ